MVINQYLANLVADLLEHSGINIDLDEEQAQKCFDDNGITFMFAPKYHKAMKNVANVRKSIKKPELFLMFLAHYQIQQMLIIKY